MIFVNLKRGGFIYFRLPRFVYRTVALSCCKVFYKNPQTYDN